MSSESISIELWKQTKEYYETRSGLKRGIWLATMPNWYTHIDYEVKVQIFVTNLLNEKSIKLKRTWNIWIFWYCCHLSFPHLKGLNNKFKDSFCWLVPMKFKAKLKYLIISYKLFSICFYTFQQTVGCFKWSLSVRCIKHLSQMRNHMDRVTKVHQSTHKWTKQPYIK